AGLRRFDPFGLSALLLGGAALLCASIRSLYALVPPASGAGLLLGLAGLLLSKGQSRSLIPIAGTAVGGIVLLTALFLPKLLGPSYLASRNRRAVDPVAIRAIPLPGSAETMGPADAAWVDASRAALQQGPMQVQVLSASIPSVKTKSSPTKTVAPPEHLYIRLR